MALGPVPAPLLPKPEDALTAGLQAAQLGEAQANLGTAQAAATQRIQQAKDTAAINAAFAQAQGDPDQTQALLNQSGSATAAAMWQDNVNKQRTQLAAQHEASLKAQEAGIGIVSQLASTLGPNSTPQQYAGAKMAMSGVMGPQGKPFLDAVMPDNPDPSDIPGILTKIQGITQTAQQHVDQTRQAMTDLLGENKQAGVARLLSLQPDLQSRGAMLQTLHERYGSTIDPILQSFVPLITQGAAPADIMKAGGIEPKTQEVGAGGTLYDVTNKQPLYTAPPAPMSQYQAAELGVRKSELSLQQQKEAREAGAQNPAGSLGTSDPSKPNGAAYLATLPQSEANTVQALAEGRIPWPTGSALRAGPWSARVDEALQYDPTLDTATISNNARQKVRNDFTSGKSAQTINAMNTLVGHLADLQQIGAGLGNTPFDVVNSVKNWLTPGGSETGVAINNFNTAKQAVADELTRVYRQAGGSEQDIQSWQSTINAAKSPAELQGAFKTIGGLLESKLGAMQAQYQQGMGTTPVSVISPGARMNLNKLQGITAPVQKTLQNGHVIEQQPDGTWKVVK